MTLVTAEAASAFHTDRTEYWAAETMRQTVGSCPNSPLRRKTTRQSKVNETRECVQHFNERQQLLNLR